MDSNKPYIISWSIISPCFILSILILVNLIGAGDKLQRLYASLQMKVGPITSFILGVGDVGLIAAPCILFTLCVVILERVKSQNLGVILCSIVFSIGIIGWTKLAISALFMPIIDLQQQLKQ